MIIVNFRGTSYFLGKIILMSQKSVLYHLYSPVCYSGLAFSEYDDCDMSLGIRNH
jgi:hypothetical protein